MPHWSSLKFLLVSLSFYAGTFPQMLQDAYVIPSYPTFEGSSSSWPGYSTWAALNNTLGGRLRTLRPWAAVCYRDDPLYDPVKCEYVLANYTNHHARGDNPSALIWTNWEGCGYHNACALNYSNPQPVSGKTCHQGSVPPYSIAISNAQDAIDVVVWATIHSVTLTIKNTGHDYLGRSSRPYSLQVLTHDLNSVEYIANFVPYGSSVAPVQALKIGAGAQLQAGEHGSVGYAANNVSAVLGSCSTVGAAGGFIQGGGNGILTPAYGLAVDHLLEVEIVTADGLVRTINAVRDPDLFWAVRGGGAGSWGIIISVTIAALPPMTASISVLSVAPNSKQNLRALAINFIALLGKYQNEIVNAGIATVFQLSKGSYDLYFIWPADKASVSVLYPLFEEMHVLSDTYTVLRNNTRENLFPTINTLVLDVVSTSVDSSRFYGASMQVSSRFVPQSMLEMPESIQMVAEAIWKGGDIANTMVNGEQYGMLDPLTHVSLFGEMPTATKQRANETGANPAFYEAAWLVTYMRAWAGTNKDMPYLGQSIYDAVDPLTALGIMGSYQNEASILESNWEEGMAFFGFKYDQLLKIKQKYDPNNFFTTYKGVGYMPSLEVYSCYHQANQQV